MHGHVCVYSVWRNSDESCMGRREVGHSQVACTHWNRKGTRIEKGELWSLLSYGHQNELDQAIL